MSSMSDQPTTAVDLARNVRDGVAKAVDIVDGYLARIDERDDEINAFNLVLADQARERAVCRSNRARTSHTPTPPASRCSPAACCWFQTWPPGAAAAAASFL